MHAPHGRWSRVKRWRRLQATPMIFSGRAAEIGIAAGGGVRVVRQQNRRDRTYKKAERPPAKREGRCGESDSATGDPPSTFAADTNRPH
jgi:hypothetical protein